MGDIIKLSVIVPVFNTPIEWIDECIESILSQGVGAIEVILIDDGSEKTCAKRCDELAHHHAEVRVLHQANQGVSAARNAGIEAAIGEFITFVDSDDMVQGAFFPSALGILEQTKADAVFGCHIEDFGASQHIQSFGWSGGLKSFSGRELEELLDYFYSYSHVKGSCVPDGLVRSLHAKVYRITSLRSSRFDSRLTFLEDGLFNADFCRDAKLIVLSDRLWYRYRVNAKSAWHKAISDVNIDTHYRAVKDHAKYLGASNELLCAHMCGFTYMAMLGSAQAGRVSFSMIRNILAKADIRQAFRGIRLNHIDLSAGKKAFYVLARLHSSFLLVILLKAKAAIDDISGKDVH